MPAKGFHRVMEAGLTTDHEGPYEACQRDVCRRALAQPVPDSLDVTGLLAQWDGYNGDTLMGELASRLRDRGR